VTEHLLLFQRNCLWDAWHTTHNVIIQSYVGISFIILCSLSLWNCKIKMKWVERLLHWSTWPVFTEYDLCRIAEVIDFEVYLFKIQFCCFKADHIANTTLLSQELFFSFVIKIIKNVSNKISLGEVYFMTCIYIYIYIIYSHTQTQAQLQLHKNVIPSLVFYCDL
jgi:hypothetical protein